MSEPLVVSVGVECPPLLRPAGVGVGFMGPPDDLYLVFADEFTDAEKQTITSGDYLVGVKLYQRDRVAGLAWSLLGRSLHMVGFANYSLRHVRGRLGTEVAAEYAEGARRVSTAGEPDCGFLLRLVFVDPWSDVVFGLRVFTLPRLFSDRLLAAILATADQDEDVAERRVVELLEGGAGVWGLARPGIAVSGEELELDEGDWARLVRRQRERR